jgi:hypothetical protein
MAYEERLVAIATPRKALYVDLIVTDLLTIKRNTTKPVERIIEYP